jgi:hypothetical protein
MAAVISLIAYQLLRPVFDQVLNTKLESVFRFSAEAVLFLLALIFVTGVIAGVYPAFVMSSSRVINAVKGKIDSAKGGLFLRKTMLTVQFTLAIIVFICALTVSRQVSYVFLKDIGHQASAFPKQ